MTEPETILSSAGTGTLSTWTGIDPADRPEGAQEPETDIAHVMSAGTGSVSTWTGQDPATAAPERPELKKKAPETPAPDAPPAQEPAPQE